MPTSRQVQKMRVLIFVLVVLNIVLTVALTSYSSDLSPWGSYVSGGVLLLLVVISVVLSVWSRRQRRQEEVAAAAAGGEAGQPAVVVLPPGQIGLPPAAGLPADGSRPPAYSQATYGQSAFGQPSAYSQSAFGQPLTSGGQAGQNSYWDPSATS